MRSVGAVWALALMIAAPGIGAAAQKPAGTAPQPVVDLSQPLTLERAIQIALRNQVALGVAYSQLESSRARITQARSAYYPQVAPSYQYSNQLTTITTRGQTITGNVEQNVAQIGAKQLLFDMGKREQNVAQSRDLARVSEFNVLDTRQTIIINVATDYYELLRRKDLVRVAEASVERARTTLESTKAAAEAGTVAGKDVFQAEADFENSRVTLIQAQNQVRLEQTTLKNAMGVVSPDPVLTPATALPAPSATPDARATADYLQQAFENRLDLKREAATIDADRRGVRVAQINAGFSVQADITEGYRVNPNPGENRNFTTTFSYPLFDAQATRAQVREARATLDQARQQVELTRQTIQLDVEQSYLPREEARSRVPATQAAVRASQENYDAAFESRREGSGTIVDVITAQAQLVTAQTNAVQAIYDYYIADARLRRATGNNDPYLAGNGKK